MKAIALVLLCGAMLLAGVSAFAAGQITVIDQQGLKSIQKWVGKPVSDLVSVLGQPTYTSRTKNGRMVYDYVQEPQHVGPIGTLQFVIGPNSDVSVTRMSY